jgi:hypothetical protein
MCHAGRTAGRQDEDFVPCDAGLADQYEAIDLSPSDYKVYLPHVCHWFLEKEPAWRSRLLFHGHEIAYQS